MTHSAEIFLTEPQEDFACSENIRPAIVGGLGSGKTRAGTARAVMRLLMNGGNVGYYMPTYDLLQLRAIPGVLEDLELLKLQHTLDKTRWMITVKGFGKIIFRSFMKPERIVAYETTDSIIDELDTLPKDKAAFVWRKISERNRQTTARQKSANSIGVVTTPDAGVSGFVYESWVRNPLKGAELIRAPSYSNPFLPDGYIDSIRENYDELLAEMYIEGEFVNLNKNKVYSFFDSDKMATSRKIEPADSLSIGIDFNVGGCCATVSVIDSGCVYLLDEFVSNDTQDFILKIKARYAGHKITVYPDASGDSRSTNASATDVQLIKQAGINVEVKAKNPFIRDRVNSVNALMSRGKFFINNEICKNTCDALTQHTYKKGEPEKFSDHPAIDDWNDSLGYFINSKFPIVRPTIITGIGRSM